jgi:hypothetical protein
MATHLDANATIQAVEAVREAVRLGDVLVPSVCAAGFGLVMWFLRENFTGLKADLADMKRTHTLCQITLARDYPTKDDLSEVRDRVDGHECRIARLEVREQG